MVHLLMMVVFLSYMLFFLLLIAGGERCGRFLMEVESVDRWRFLKRVELVLVAITIILNVVVIWRWWLIMLARLTLRLCRIVMDVCLVMGTFFVAVDFKLCLFLFLTFNVNVHLSQVHVILVVVSVKTWMVIQVLLLFITLFIVVENAS